MNDENPYRASGATLEHALPRLDIDSASKVRRFFNWLIDRVAVYLAFAAVGIVAALTGNLAVLDWMQNIDRITDIVVTSSILVAYYTLMEGAFGFTLGKLVTNTRVVDEYGQPPAFRKAFYRSLCRLIPFNAFSLLMSDDETRRGWHDSIPKTYVVMRPRRGAPVGKPRHNVSHQFGASAIGPAPVPAPAVEP
ncbi:RDD family protein [Lysobacter solisilvae (ex Woo and Kim 2020)]|uniref:RDD family protein n=1 Tax=Agrilutibacter terrestris TaxID=2865112 RepID=A0A7H0G0W4_9GAMM|nr:RDD family protein [Lysobacter terrestris]QNP41930.1 RDD family protein [Lysobacter terrestris]